MVKSPEGKVDGLTKGGKDTKSKDAIKDLKNQKNQRSPEGTVKSKNTRQHRLLKHGGKEMTLKKDWFVGIWITQVSRRISRCLAGMRDKQGSGQTPRVTGTGTSGYGCG